MGHGSHVEYCAWGKASSCPTGLVVTTKARAKGHPASGRREQLWEGQGSVTEEVTGPQFVGGERPKELLVQAPGMTREGRVRPVLRLQPRLVGRPRRLPGAALTPSDPLGAASKTQAPSPLETGLHPGPGVEACCPVVGKSGTSPCGS